MRYVITYSVRARLFKPIILTLAFSCLAGTTSVASEVSSETHQIDIVSRGVVTTDAVAPRFSPNGKYLFYQKAPDRGMIVNANTFKPVSSHKLRGMVGRAAWSPDSKKIAYCNGDKLHMLDIGASKTTEIPNPGRTCVSDAWVWNEPYGILFVEGGNYSVLNLETLRTDMIFQSRSFGTFRPLRPAERAALKKEESEYNAKRSSLDHQLRRQDHATAYVHPGYNSNGLLLSALDDSYHKLLLNGAYYPHSFDVSPNLDSIVYVVADMASSELRYTKLRKGKPRPTKFMVAFNKQEQLSRQQQQDFEKYWQGVRIRSDDSLTDGELSKPSFWGDVYEPQVNPLTGKVVGPNQEKPKGRVIFESSTDTNSIVRSYFETVPIKSGDIVTNIRSDMPGGRGFSAGNIWLPLKSMQEASASSSQATP